MLPAGTWRDVITGNEHPSGEVPVAELLGTGPVAVLEHLESR